MLKSDNAHAQLEETIEKYLEEEPNAGLRAEIGALRELGMSGDLTAQAELQDRFGRLTDFGTAGLRGRMEAGLRRMNQVLVGKLAWALAQHVGEGGSIVIGFDARRNSALFAEEIASVLSAFGVRVHMIEKPVATPICAFAIVDLSAQCGAMVTASHNPPEDNGVKVYNRDGAQITASEARAIERFMTMAPGYKMLPRLDKIERLATKKEIPVPDAVIDRYFLAIRQYAWRPASRNAPELKIVYTPLHGVGADYTSRALEEAGFRVPLMVESQALPDERFPTLRFPNPEEPGVLELGIEYARAQDADLLVANDPDADRLAVAVRNREGNDFVMLSGNQVGILLGAQGLEFASVPNRKLVATTVVSSRMLKRLAELHGASYLETLTGFSNIVNSAMTREREGHETFVFGYEEALGYLVGNFVRDKDGISAAVRFAELFASLRAEGKTVWDEFDRLALLCGVHRSLQWTMRFVGPTATLSISERMKEMRTNIELLRSCFLDSVETVQDLLLPAQASSPSADVLIFTTRSHTRLVIRPSGTEPKIKFYLEVVEPVSTLAALPETRLILDERLKTIRSNIEALVNKPKPCGL